MKTYSIRIHWTVIALLTLAVMIVLAGCATRHQPPGGGLSAVVAHTEAQRKP